MGRKSKANTGNDGNTSKKIKVSKVEDAQEDDGPWDGIRVIVEQVICRSDGCEERATATWISQKTGDQWDMCNKCQLRDFGECYRGDQLLQHETTPEPIEIDETPPKQIPPQDNSATIIRDLDASSAEVNDTTSSPLDDSSSNEMPTEQTEECRTVSDDSSPSESPSLSPSTSESMQEESKIVSPNGSLVSQTEEETVSLSNLDDTDGQYDLKQVLSLEDLLKEDTICCSQENCDLSAFGLYVNSKNDKDRWYYCLDCQESDFDGWPPAEELPINYIEPKHLSVMALKCSSRKDPRMPIFSSPSPKGKLEDTANFVTPPPPLKESTSLVNTKEIGAAKASGKAKAIEVHKKWLEAAQAMGGKDARIVVSKPAAKKLIFDFLYDSFQPMNITQIFKV